MTRPLEGLNDSELLVVEDEIDRLLETQQPSPQEANHGENETSKGGRGSTEAA